MEVFQFFFQTMSTGPAGPHPQVPPTGLCPLLLAPSSTERYSGHSLCNTLTAILDETSPWAHSPASCLGFTVFLKVHQDKAVGAGSPGPKSCFYPVTPGQLRRITDVPPAESACGVAVTCRRGSCSLEHSRASGTQGISDFASFFLAKWDWVLLSTCKQPAGLGYP